MSEPRMRWWGWGEPDHAIELSAAGEELLRSEIGLADGSTPPVALEDVRLPEPALPETVGAALRAAVGDEHVRADREARVRHAAGRSYPDLFRLRTGDGSGAPDAVVWPGEEGEVVEVIRVCDSEGVAVVPFGGGTSVVGGVEALRDGHAAAIALDLRRLDSLRSDRVSLTATIGAGLPGRLAESRLQARGLTLGHFPQSYEFGSIGGYVATRSAGQSSTGYGRIDEKVIGRASCRERVLPTV